MFAFVEGPQPAAAVRGWLQQWSHVAELTCAVSPLCAGSPLCLFLMKAVTVNLCVSRKLSFLCAGEEQSWYLTLCRDF